MDELLKSMDAQSYSLIGAGIATASAFLYKITRIIKRDNKEDSLDFQEQEFRNVLLTELKLCKDFSHQMLIEKAELKSEIARLTEQVSHLLSMMRKAGLDVDSLRNRS